jgi:hypothetical protein
MYHTKLKPELMEISAERVKKKSNVNSGKNHSPGVMQLESNLASVGRVSPFCKAFFIFSSASRADLKRNSFYLCMPPPP